MINVLQSNLNAINGWILLDNSSRLQRQKWKRELNIETLNHIHNYWVWMLLAVFLGESIWKLRNVLCWQTSVAVLCTFKLFPVQKKNSFSFFFKKTRFSLFQSLQLRANCQPLTTLRFRHKYHFEISVFTIVIACTNVRVLRQKLKRRVRRHKFCWFVHP